MRIAEFFESDESTRGLLLQALRQCDWEAGKFLLRLLAEETFAETLGGKGRLLFGVASSWLNRLSRPFGR